MLWVKVDYVFMIGGIGLIYDDIIVDSIVRVFGVGIDVCVDVLVIIEYWYEKIGMLLIESCK